MQDFAAILLQILYTIGMVGLAIYGIHAALLTWKVRPLLRRGEGDPLLPQPAPPQNWPAVTIQLPVYNERDVVERLIDACARQDYPHDRLQIQLLDDSSDGTRAITERRAAFWRQRGIDITVVERRERTGYKAGALAFALPAVTGEFIAIFDADFVPPADFLRRLIPYLLVPENAGVGFVQGRWGHLNRGYSPLTHSQALALDGHFAVEQEGRQAAGYFFGFNGSAGIWRRACIEDPRVGGWQADTLCEDLDLSYRAQLAGWRPCYVNDVVAAAEIPPQLAAFKRQQFRWAKGSVQTLRKVGCDVWACNRPLATRLTALFHLGSYLLHPLLLTLLLVSGPLMLLDVDPAGPLALLSVATIGPPLLYAVAQARLNPSRWWRHYAYLPLLMLLGTGICLSNTRAVWQGLNQRGGHFLRTPKFSVETVADRWQQSRYRLEVDNLFWGEVSLLALALLTAALAALQHRWLSVPFLLLYAGGFALMTGTEFWQSRMISQLARRRQQHEPGKPGTANY